jgi:anti-sigma28 factor (negative regulator of flagellin synthesis)
MRIHQQKTDLSTDRSEQSRSTGRAGSEVSGGETRTRQVGLDRVDVSRTGETAASMIEKTWQERQSRVAQLAKTFQAGNYTPNLSTLSLAIVDHDSEVGLSYAGE